MIEVPKVEFHYAIPARITLTMPLLRRTLRDVQAQLLSHNINGGGKKLMMETTTKVDNRCGMAACLGGWASLFLLGFDKTRNNELEGPADELFSQLIHLDNNYGTGGQLNHLFHEYHRTEDYNEPNVAATAIKRYLAGKEPWPRGVMPHIMAYTKRAYRKHK